MANEVTSAAKKKAILLSTCGVSTYSTIRCLAALTKPMDLEYSALLESTKKHFNPEPSVIMQRYKFNSRNQKLDESISTYVVELCNLTEFCDFGDSINDMLRDKFVSGLHNTRTQHRLLAEKALTFPKAQEIAQAMELADKDVQSLQSNPHPPVFKLNEQHTSTQRNSRRNVTQHTTRHRNPQTLPCHCCGGKHSSSTCRFKTEQCHVCGKVGHISRVCRNRQHRGGRERGYTANVVDEHTTQADTSSQNTEYTLFPIKSLPTTPPWRTVLTINGIQMEMEIDTGASVFLISKNTFDKFQFSAAFPPLINEQIKLCTYTGEEISVLGSISVTAKSENCTSTLPLLVVEGNGPSLMGRNWLTELRLDWKTVYAMSLSHSLEEVLEQNKEIFQKGLGKIKGVEAKLHLDTQVKPLYFKVRSVLFALRQKVEHELERLENQGVITPVQFSECATPTVPVVKSDGTLRLCGDYKLTANKVSKTEIYPLSKIEEPFASLSGGQTFSKLDLSHAYLQVPFEKES